MPSELELKLIDAGREIDEMGNSLAELHEENDWLRGLLRRCEWVKFGPTYICPVCKSTMNEYGGGHADDCELAAEVGEMSSLKVGDAVEVMDPGLIMLQKFAPPGAKPNNRGYVYELNYGDDNDVLVEFPIGDDPMDEHSQVAPYPMSMIRRRKTT